MFTSDVIRAPQYMPLVGVPSFIEFSQKRNLRYFFVLVRQSEDGTAEAPQPEAEKEIQPIKSSPIEAFVAASAEEPWGDRMEATSQESAEAKRAARELMERAAQDRRADAKPKVSLPLNPEAGPSYLLRNLSAPIPNGVSKAARFCKP